MPYHRYRSAAQRVRIPVQSPRAWPDATCTRAPLWVPVDLRDGNQALAEPMDPDRKRLLFQLLIRTGFKEIEVGYPSASRADFDFVRDLATGDEVPDDVLPVVFTPARPDLIERTFESIAGHRRAVVHLCAATAPVWREVVFGADRATVRAMIVAAGEELLRGADRLGEVDVRFQFSPEVFNLTEPDFALEICDTLSELWQATPQRPVTHNLPTTVETTTPNLYADQIEYFHRNLARRDGVILSVHPHNDRGTGVASAELAVLAGAQRVEGCLFGNGERTGNVDLVTLAMNLHAQGVDPMLDLSDIDEIRRVVEHCNRIRVHERHPYGGDLVYTAFSGTHQDAISKGLAHHERQAARLGLTAGAAPWEVPYLPIDPADVGRDYTAVIRINSQSGKGGVAHVLHHSFGIDLPRPLRIEFSRYVQSVTDDDGTEVTAKQLWDLFRRRYLEHTGPVELVDGQVTPGDPQGWRFDGTVRLRRLPSSWSGTGDDPARAVAAAARAAGIDVGVDEVVQQRSTDPDGGTAMFVRCQVDGVTWWGAGVADEPANAAVQAVLGAVNRALSGG